MEVQKHTSTELVIKSKQSSSSKECLSFAWGVTLFYLVYIPLTFFAFLIMGFGFSSSGFIGWVFAFLGICVSVFFTMSLVFSAFSYLCQLTLYICFFYSHSECLFFNKKSNTLTKETTFLFEKNRQVYNLKNITGVGIYCSSLYSQIGEYELTLELKLMPDPLKIKGSSTNLQQEIENIPQVIRNFLPI